MRRAATLSQKGLHTRTSLCNVRSKGRRTKNACGVTGHVKRDSGTARKALPAGAHRNPGGDENGLPRLRPCAWGEYIHLNSSDYVLSQMGAFHWM